MTLLATTYLAGSSPLLSQWGGKGERCLHVKRDPPLKRLSRARVDEGRTLWLGRAKVLRGPAGRQAERGLERTHLPVIVRLESKTFLDKYHPR